MFDALHETRPHIRTYYEDMDNPRLKKLFQNPKGLLDFLIRHACRTEEHPIPECVANLKAGLITAAYSTGDLADKMGVNRTTIGNWLNELEAMGVLARPFGCAASGTRNIYVLGYCHLIPMKEAGGFKRAFVYYMNDPLPAKGEANSHQGGEVISHQGGDEESHQGGEVKIGQKHIGHESPEGIESKRQAPSPSGPKKIIPGSGDTAPSGIEPSTPGKTSSRASKQPKQSRSEMVNGGVSKVEFRHAHEDEIIAAFEKKYKEVEGLIYEADERDRAKVRHLLAVGHPKDEILAAISFYISARKRFTWGDGLPTLALFAAPKFYLRLAAKDKTLFAKERQDAPNSGVAASEAEAPIVDKLKEIWS